MRKIANLLLVAVLLTLVAFAGASAQSSQPSAKVTAKVADLTSFPLDPNQKVWNTVLTQKIKTANQKDLFINPSLECGLFTQTKVSSQKLNVATAMADATVDVRVLVDGKPAAPSRDVAADPNKQGNGVTYCRRQQTLTAALAGYETCVTDPVTGVVTCSIDDEWIDLMLDTMDANSFNFIYSDLASGVHEVTVQARITTNSSATSGLSSASARGYMGFGSVTIESVRMIKGEDVVDLP